MKTILIAGGSGQIGNYLSNSLLKKGYNVSLLSRQKLSLDKITTHIWNVEKREIDEIAIKNADFIVNLSGANIGAKRWSPERKKEIIDSRVESNRLLFETVKKLDKKIEAFITSSAVGYYGMKSSDKIFTENDEASDDFIAGVCFKWEEASNPFEKLGIRTIKIRTGVVLNKGEGALSKMMLPIKMFVGSPLGSGKQYVPWIHIEDLCNIYIKAIEDISIKGAYNAVAPKQVTNEELTYSIAKRINRPLFLPNVPAKVLKLFLGEMAGLVLQDIRVSSNKISKAGYKFTFGDMKAALNDLV